MDGRLEFEQDRPQVLCTWRRVCVLPECLCVRRGIGLGIQR